jgi:hypothetical protein
MRKIILLAALFVVLSAVSTKAQSKFGLGLIIGEPTGVSGKYFLDKKSAIDGAFAWSFVNYGALNIHGDYLYHFDNVFTPEVPVYVGIGGRVKFASSDANKSDDTRFGLRVPVGLAWMPPKTPIDLFVEIIPIMDIAPSTEFTLAAAAGIRYYFH